MKKITNKQMVEHFKADIVNFKKIDDILTAQNEDHKIFHEKLTKIGESMENLSGLSDFLKGSSLLRKPLMLFVGLILGVVALVGGLKTILGWFIVIK